MLRGPRPCFAPLFSRYTPFSLSHPVPQPANGTNILEIPQSVSPFLTSPQNFRFIANYPPKK